MPPSQPSTPQDLSLEIASASTIQDALQRFVAPEHLDGDNKYMCAACWVCAADGLALQPMRAQYPLLLCSFQNLCCQLQYTLAHNSVMHARACTQHPLPTLMAPRGFGIRPSPALPQTAPWPLLRCEACKQLVRARKQMLIYDDPNVLVIHLKRFDGFHGGKISGHVAFGETLDLTPYLGCRGKRRWQRRCAAAGGKAGACGSCVAADAAGAVAADGAGGRSLYQLHGVLVHSGFSATSGHYYSYVRDGLHPNNGWHCANDSSVYRWGCAVWQGWGLFGVLLWW